MRIKEIETDPIKAMADRSIKSGKEKVARGKLIKQQHKAREPIDAEVVCRQGDMLGLKFISFPIGVATLLNSIAT